MGMVDWTRVEGEVTAGELRGNIGTVEHAGTGATAARRPGRVPRVSGGGAVRPCLRAGEQSAELVVDVSGSEEAVRAGAARPVRLRRQVAQDAVDRRHLTTADISCRPTKIGRENWAYFSTTHGRLLSADNGGRFLSIVCRRLNDSPYHSLP